MYDHIYIVSIREQLNKGLLLIPLATYSLRKQIKYTSTYTTPWKGLNTLTCESAVDLFPLDQRVISKHKKFYTLSHNKTYAVKAVVPPYHWNRAVVVIWMCKLKEYQTIFDFMN